MKDFTIYLGPLLGIESDTLYSVCILVNSNDDILPQDIILCLDNRSVKSVGHVLIRKSYWFIKFEFESRNDSEYRVLRNYYFTDKNYSKYINVNGAEFSFWEAPINEIPVVGFVSCNGSDKHYPIPSDSKLYSGWEHISKKLDNDYRMDYLFLTGDQVYADSIFDEIEQLYNLLEEDTEISDELKEQIDSFYLKLYIDSWKNSFVAKALSSIPNVMVWDDHDIIDGFGSLDNSHDNPVLKEVFNVASKYYKIFQRRLWQSTDIGSKNLLACSVIKVRNYLFVLPDTRSFRTPCQVMAPWQYNKILSIGSDQNIIDWVASVKDSYSYLCLCFIVPVPVAHINYTSWIEKLNQYLEKVLKLNWFVKKGLDDDMLDHWDHKNHQVEQIKFLDTVFTLADKLKPKNVIIVSGDVHSNGAAKITKVNDLDLRYATQLICSPIVNEPFPRNFTNFILWFNFAIQKERIQGYTLDLKNFGKTAKSNIAKRSFMYITSGNNHLKAKLIVEEGIKWELFDSPRTINNFIDDK